MTSNQALGDVIAAIVETLKRQSLFELGKALGISAPEPVPASIPEGAAGAGAAMYRAQLEAIRETLEAGGSDSLAALITSRTEQVGERIDALLTKVIDDLAVIEGPMRSMAAETPGDLDGIYDSIADLRGLFESDVVSLLDITLGFSDTDGDSG
jgi:predicted lipoprotein